MSSNRAASGAESRIEKDGGDELPWKKWRKHSITPECKARFCLQGRRWCVHMAHKVFAASG